MKRYAALGLIWTALLVSAAAFAQETPPEPPAAEPAQETEEGFERDVDRLTEQVRDAINAAMREMSKAVETTVQQVETPKTLPQPVEIVFAITGVAENMSVVTAQTDYQLSISRERQVQLPSGAQATRITRETSFTFGAEGSVTPLPDSVNLFNVTFDGSAQYRVSEGGDLTQLSFEGELPLELGKTVTIARENDQKVTITIRPLEAE